MCPVPSFPARCCPTCAADAAYRSLLASTADVITVLDAEGTIRYQTPSIEDLLGQPPALLTLTKLVEIVHPDEREWIVAQFERVKAQPGPAEGTTVARWRHRDGGYRSVESKTTNLLDDPAVNGIVVSSRDVTDRVTLEEQ